MIHFSLLQFLIPSLFLSISTLFIASDGRELLSFHPPSDIKVPTGNKLHLVLHGIGIQHYIYNGSTWNIENATAALYTHKKRNPVGKHFYLPKKDLEGGQPSWETFRPKSLVTAKTIKAIPWNSNSITWNLLQVTEKTGSKKRLGSVTYVQRIGTKGGLPPSGSFAMSNGDRYASPYSATYVFFVKRPTSS